MGGKSTRPLHARCTRAAYTHVAEGSLRKGQQRACGLQSLIGSAGASGLRRSFMPRVAVILCRKCIRRLAGPGFAYVSVATALLRAISLRGCPVPAIFLAPPMHASRAPPL